MILLDTHALLGWALEPRSLSPKASEVVARMEREGGFASSISIWELAIKVKRGQLDLGVTVDEFARRIDRSGAVELLPVDTSTWLRSVALPWDHRDPADRVIVATALKLGLPILTKDETIRSFSGARAIW